MTPSRPSAARRLVRLQRGVVAAVVALLALVGVLYAKSEAIVLGAEAYVYAYPLVMMDVTRTHAQETLGPENHLLRVRRFPDAQFKAVVRPNLDTLYTTAFIDMDAGPWVFDMPPNQQRYELMPFMDAWTNVFASPGTRTTGTGGGRFLLASARWAGTVPAGMTLLRAPTRMVWLIGRTQTDGPADYPVVHRLQDGLQLRRLADLEAGVPAPAPTWAKLPSASPPPIERMRAMDVAQFFARFARLLPDNPPPAADGPMLAKLARLGITPGQAPAWGMADRWAIALGRSIADFTVARELGKRPTVRGWTTPPAQIGDFGTHYNIRAVVAMIGLGANLPADASYPVASVDSTGQRLHGKHRYRLHFTRDALPPVRAFWSVTAYGSDDFLIENPQGRHKLGNRDPLQFNPDGSLDLWIQAEAPEPGRLSNWLPVQAGEPFVLNARLYWPQAAALDGRWAMPGIERQD